MSPVDSTAAMTALQSAPLNAPRPTNDPVAAKKAAQQFEGVFITQFLGEMFNGISTDGPFGGGQGEEMFRSLMMDEYGKQLAAQGGFGLADAVTRELLKTQETAQ
jgi:peptidoglycan hydrolase FlgJ